MIKGDTTLESIFPPKDEKPEWATFDEDLPEDADGASAVPDGAVDVTTASAGPRDGSPCTRYPIRTMPRPHRRPPDNRKKPRRRRPAPAVAADLDYPALTLAQLRARLQSLDVDELEALLAYEQATKARAPFQTLLANRITRATAK